MVNKWIKKCKLRDIKVIDSLCGTEIKKTILPPWADGAPQIVGSCQVQAQDCQLLLPFVSWGHRLGASPPGLGSYLRTNHLQDRQAWLAYGFASSKDGGGPACIGQIWARPAKLCTGHRRWQLLSLQVSTTLRQEEGRLQENSRGGAVWLHTG